MSKYIKIKIDVDSGEASAEVTEAFEMESGIWQLDILKDIISDLSAIYDATHEDVFSPKNDTQETQA